MPRPKKDDPRDVNFTIRFSAAEIDQLRIRAKAAGRSPADFARAAIFDAAIAAVTAAAPDPATRELVYEVNKVGVNLNQIARRMNEDRTQPPRDLLLVLDEIRAYVRKAAQAAP